MTTTEAAPTETPEITETAVVKATRALVGKAKSFDATELLVAVAESRRSLPVAPDKTAETPAPKVVGRDTPLPKEIVKLSEEARTVAYSTIGLLDTIELPTEHRRLRATELTKLLAVYPGLGKSISALEDAKKSIQTAVNNHFNIALEAAGAVTDETQVDTHGNWALKTDTSDVLPEAELRFNRGYRRASLTVDPDVLLQLKNDKKITTTLYNRVTRPARVVDEHGFSSAIAREPELMDILSEAIVETNAPQVPLSVGRNTTKK